MTLLKSVVATILFILFLELIAIWTLLALVIDLGVLIDSYYTFVNGCIEVGVVLFFIYKIHGFKGIIPRETKAIYYLYAFLLGTAFIFMQLPLNVVYEFISGIDYRISYGFDAHGLQSINAVSVILFIPIAEELFFRRYLQNGLQSKYKSIMAILSASLLFAVIHLPFQTLYIQPSSFDPHQAYIAFFGGLISGTLYHLSKSVGPSLLFHLMWNFMVSLV